MTTDATFPQTYLCPLPHSSAKQQLGTRNQETEANGAAVIPVTQGQAVPSRELPDRVWHYDEEFRSGGESPKPASSGSQEQGEGAASSGGFVALNLSSGRQDFDSREWVMVERPSGSPGAKVTTSPSEEDEEPEVLLPGEQERGGPSPSCEKTRQERTASSIGSVKVDKLELSVGPAGALPAITPTSPAEALAEGVLTQVGASVPAHISDTQDTGCSQRVTPLQSRSAVAVDAKKPVRETPTASCCGLKPKIFYVVLLLCVIIYLKKKTLIVIRSLHEGIYTYAMASCV